MSTFAGFWRDGAVVKPEERHCDYTKEVVARDKSDGGYISKRFTSNNWDNYYWLDTTTPIELTPQEAFELQKAITPTLERIEKQGSLYSAYADERISIINWGPTTEYPPRERWRVPTDADKGKRCRYWDDGEDLHVDGTFITTIDGRYLVLEDNDYLAWDNCEVLE